MPSTLTASEKAYYRQLAKDLVEETGCSRREACFQVKRDHPESSAAFMDMPGDREK